MTDVTIERIEPNYVVLNSDSLIAIAKIVDGNINAAHLAGVVGFLRNGFVQRIRHSDGTWRYGLTPAIEECFTP